MSLLTMVFTYYAKLPYSAVMPKAPAYKTSLNILRITLLCTCFLGLTSFKQNLREIQLTLTSQIKEEPIYLPETKYVKMITLGFDNFLSDILWFNTLSYFGEHFAGDKDFRWFAHMCDLVTELDPQKITQFDFCSTLTSWIAKEPIKSTKLLSKAINHHPHYWRFYYLRGFTSWYFLHDKEKAKQDFAFAAKLPDSPRPFLASLASRLMVSEENDPDTAMFFLRDMIKNTKDETAKEALVDQYKKAMMSKQVRIIQSALELYEKRFAKNAISIEELQSSGLLTGTPVDPYGGKYKLNKKTLKITSTSKKKPLEFYGKTAETGAARHEFAPEKFKDE